MHDEATTPEQPEPDHDPRKDEQATARAAHIVWSATPEAQREPKTKSEWAEQLGCSLETLAEWERQPGFWLEVHTCAFRHVAGNMTEVLASLSDTAKQRGPPWNKDAVRIYLDTMLHWKSREERVLRARELQLEQEARLRGWDRR
ncbi:MAG: hypothetical protein M3220_15785 [Chloroflexota bacterium]|nr:hypothetical protein [Chloroflexota bacterium]